MRRERRALLGLLLVACTATEARASTVRRLSEAELAAGAERIVEGVVANVRSRWNPQRTGLETSIDLDVTRTLQGNASPRVTVIQPGGELDGDRHIIPGMPAFRLGERVRVYLRPRPGGGFRVFGWAQGKWIAERTADGERFVSSVHQLGGNSGHARFSHNGLVWPVAEQPVQYLINSAGSDDLAFADAKQAIFTAFATWQQVTCSSLAYSYAGDTALTVAVDDINVVMWIESGWIYGEEAAGAAAIWAPKGGNPTVDVALNGEHFSWAVGVPGVGPATQDVIGVLTHELGHFSGLSHTMSALDTMYYSWTPWQSQRSLSADDKLGLCALYPQMGDECTSAADCDPGATCEAHPLGTLCAPQPDAIGAPCNYDRVECAHFCLFTALNLSSGYCSRFCDTSDECGQGFVCQNASAGGDPVKVCFVDPDYVPADGGFRDIMCSADDGCPGGWYCGDMSLCTRDCREDLDCNGAGLVCQTARGKCVAANGSDGGCGCGSSGLGGGLAVLMAALGLVLGRRRRR